MDDRLGKKAIESSGMLWAALVWFSHVFSFGSD